MVIALKYKCWQLNGIAQLGVGLCTTRELTSRIFNSSEHALNDKSTYHASLDNTNVPSFRPPNALTAKLGNDIQCQLPSQQVEETGVCNLR